MSDIDRATIESALRTCADLNDVMKAIAIAAKLSAEKLEAIESDLLDLLTVER